MTTPGMGRTRSPGIYQRHSRSCKSNEGERCNCKPSYTATAYSRRDKKRITKTCRTLAEAKNWRADAQAQLEKGTLGPRSKATLTHAANEWLDGAKSGAIRNRSGDRYKPSALRGYERVLEGRVLPALGRRRLSDIRLRDVQGFVGDLMAKGLDASTIRNALMPLRAIYRRALASGEVTFNPVNGVELPAVRGKRDRIADPTEATKLIDAVPIRDRTVWATAMYAGLRLGELKALKWENVDLASGVIKVRHSWDPIAGEIEPKSNAGKRSVPIPAVLRDELVEHGMRECHNKGRVFRSPTGKPFHDSELGRRAKAAWKDAGLKPITLHSCRHTFASMMIAAGVNAKALSSYLGHTSITVTLDRYGHLMPGKEDEAAELMDA